ncbi:MAG: cyclic pyranopterin monophosphate synthase MoaC [Candidatus Pelagibacter sp.]|jgi:cyclic pyranopterin monophosphate synthase|nr:cyclic pyranopterin monophosphate synthase MoaC [Pseudomonadota bacterium]NQW07565.1 cyclic pyranopterin monophosphate synthase MoaC [Candidatus Pelagibacter sp.]|tara:strand:+ start:1492 stop:1968 length:477 start_codon:yes stop_codon:yes gene_type:complete
MLTHIDANGNAQMVDITEKNITHRLAIASGMITMQQATLKLIQKQGHKKGDVLTVAKIAGIQAAKNTSGLIPLCHPISISGIEINFIVNEETPSIICHATVECSGQTGVEMEALTAVSISLLTIYDMCKAVDRGMKIIDVQLLHKDGGKSGLWRNKSI